MSRSYKLELVHIYLLARCVIRVCKKVSSEEVCQNVIIIMLGVKPMTIRELSTLFTVTHSLMSEIIAKLEKEGLVVKKKQAKDKRYRLIALTEKGKKLLKGEVEESLKNYTDVAYKNMTDKEIKTLDSLIQKLSFESLL